MVLSTSDITLMSISFTQKGILVKIPLRKKCSWHNTKHVRATLIMFNIFGTVSNSCGIENYSGNVFSKVVSKANKAYTQQTSTHCSNLMWNIRALGPGRKTMNAAQTQLPRTDQRRVKEYNHRIPIPKGCCEIRSDLGNCWPVEMKNGTSGRKSCSWQHARITYYFID